MTVVLHTIFILQYGFGFSVTIYVTVTAFTFTEMMLYTALKVHRCDFNGTLSQIYIFFKINI